MYIGNVFLRASEHAFVEYGVETSQVPYQGADSAHPHNLRPEQSLQRDNMFRYVDLFFSAWSLCDAEARFPGARCPALSFRRLVKCRSPVAHDHRTQHSIFFTRPSPVL